MRLRRSGPVFRRGSVGRTGPVWVRLGREQRHFSFVLPQKHCGLKNIYYLYRACFWIEFSEACAKKIYIYLRNKKGNEKRGKRGKEDGPDCGKSFISPEEVANL